MNNSYSTNVSSNDHTSISNPQLEFSDYDIRLLRDTLKYFGGVEDASNLSKLVDAVFPVLGKLVGHLLRDNTKGSFWWLKKVVLPISESYTVHSKYFDLIKLDSKATESELKKAKMEFLIENVTNFKLAFEEVIPALEKGFLQEDIQGIVKAGIAYMLPEKAPMKKLLRKALEDLCSNTELKVFFFALLERLFLKDGGFKLFHIMKSMDMSATDSRMIFGNEEEREKTKRYLVELLSIERENTRSWSDFFTGSPYKKSRFEEWLEKFFTPENFKDMVTIFQEHFSKDLGPMTGSIQLLSEDEWNIRLALSKAHADFIRDGLTTGWGEAPFLLKTFLTREEFLKKALNWKDGTEDSLFSDFKVSLGKTSFPNVLTGDMSVTAIWKIYSAYTTWQKTIKKQKEAQKTLEQNTDVSDLVTMKFSYKKK